MVAETAARSEGPGPDDGIAVVVVNYASSDLLSRNLGRSVPAGGLATAFVVDNFSSEAERRTITKLASERGWQVALQDSNGGFARGVNVGVAMAVSQGFRRFLLLNPDAIVPPPVVTALSEQCAADPMAMVAPRIVDSAGRNYFRGSGLALRDGAITPLCDNRRQTTWSRDGQLPPAGVVPWLTGACLAFSLESWASLGGMDERFFLYWEDVDLGFRAYRAGVRLMVRTDLCAIHDEGGTQERSGVAKSNHYYYYNCRNRLIFGSKYLTRRELLRWLIRTPAASWKILMRGGRRQLLHSPMPLLSVTGGSIAGISRVLGALVGRRRDLEAMR